MLTSHTTVFSNEYQEAPFGQDKKALPRLSVASPQASTPAETALNTEANTNTPLKQKHHSTKRQTIFAGCWVYKETDAYIEHRLREGKKADPNLSRSSVIRTMLEERALDGIIVQQHATLAPMIRETMQAEHRGFENRNLAETAKIVYEVSKIIPLLIGFFDHYLPPNVMQQIETDADTAARVNATRRTQQVDEVLQRLKRQREVAR